MVLCFGGTGGWVGGELMDGIVVTPGIFPSIHPFNPNMNQSRLEHHHHPHTAGSPPSHTLPSPLERRELGAEGGSRDVVGIGQHGKAPQQQRIKDIRLFVLLPTLDVRE